MDSMTEKIGSKLQTLSPSGVCLSMLFVLQIGVREPANWLEWVSRVGAIGVSCGALVLINFLFMRLYTFAKHLQDQLNSLHQNAPE